MPDWVSNAPISTPIHLPDVQSDVDLNGLQFNYDIGMFYIPGDEPVLPFKLPSIFEEPQ